MASAQTAHTLSGFRWEADVMEFEFADAGRQIACSISREALEEAGAGLRARNWQLQEMFDRLQKRIVRILLEKQAVAKPNSRAALHVSASDLNTPAAPARAERGR